MKRLHRVPGLDDIANGMAVVARLIAREQGDAEVVGLNHGNHGTHGSEPDEVWVHGMWLPREWLACWRALSAGRRLVRMTHGSLSPVYLSRQGKWKKRLVSPIERFFLRRADCVVATCQAEADWIRAFEPRVGKIEVTDLKRFFKLGREEARNPKPETRKPLSPLHLLYLGRRHPLKGVQYLEAAVRQIQEPSAPSVSPRLCVKYLSSALGAEKEVAFDWCDVLVLPTLSENFGLVVAEALERGKRVITTDGAPAWDPAEGGDFDGRLIYLRGYRDATDEKRVGLLASAIRALL